MLQHTDTGPASSSADPFTPGAWQGSRWSTNFQVCGMTRPGKRSMPKSGIESRSAAPKTVIESRSAGNRIQVCRAAIESRSAESGNRIQVCRPQGGHLTTTTTRSTSVDPPWLSFSSQRPPRWPSGKVSASRAEDTGFESRLRRDFFGVESYQ